MKKKNGKKPNQFDREERQPRETSQMINKKTSMDKIEYIFRGKTVEKAPGNGDGRHQEREKRSRRGLKRYMISEQHLFTWSR